MNDYKRLNFENILWIIFIIGALINIKGNNLLKKYLITEDERYKIKSSDLFLFSICLTFLIYIYFFVRNYNQYLKTEKKELYLKKLLGSAFLIAAALLLIYFQIEEERFIGSPAI